MLFPKNRKRQIAYCYNEQELAEVLAQVGLTPSPIPDRPFVVTLPDGRELKARDEFIAGAMDEPGSSRIVVNIF